MKNKYIAPGIKKESFTCPGCSTLSQQRWDWTYVSNKTGQLGSTLGGSYRLLYSCRCECCGYISFWYDDKLIWPLNTGIVAPYEEMPEDIKSLYNEARSIVELSPKGSCAILRLALQKLCNRLAGQDEKNDLNVAIQKLVENGLPSVLQMAMDTVRIVGNEAVHPGEIIIDDNKELAISMFELINIIVEKMIIEPKRIEELFNNMPADKIDGINNRDKKKNTNYEVNSK